MLAAAVLAVVTLAGCGGAGGTSRLSWDLRAHHTRADVGYTGRLSAFEMDRPTDVTIRLPGGRTLRLKAARIDVEFDDLHPQQVVGVDVTLPDTTYAEGHRRATALCGEWGLDTRNLDAWYAALPADRRRAPDPGGMQMNGSVVMDGPRLGTDGPITGAEGFYSFDDSRPFMLVFELAWDPEP